MNIVELLNTAHDIGRPIEIKFDDSTFEYTVNGIPPREVPVNYFLVLKNKYDTKLHIQLKHKPNQSFFDRVLKELDQYIHINRKDRNAKVSGYDYIKLTDRATESNSVSYAELLAIYDAQYAVLDRMKKDLLIYAELRDLIIDTDFTFKDEVPIGDGTGLINYGSSGKVTFKTNRIDALMFLYVLEASNLIEFESETQRHKFIESNFNYTELRNNVNKDKALPMKGVNSDFANFKSSGHVKENNGILKNLLDKLENSIHCFKFKR